MFEPIVIVVSLIMSFFFSGTETAFVSVNKVRVEVWRRSGARYAAILYDFVEKPERFLYTTLIGNNIFNVAFATYATIYFNRFWPSKVTWLVVVLLTLFMGEIIPKTLFRSLADLAAQKMAYPLRFFYMLFRPLITAISKISELLLTLFGYQRDDLDRFFNEQDVEILLNESQNRVKDLDAGEGEFFSRVLSLRELRVRDAMVQRTEMVAVPDTITLDALRDVFVRNGYTKIPVFSVTIDHFIGVVFAKDLLLEPTSFQEILRPVMFVPDTKRCSELLSEFRGGNTSLAMVIDEYGGTAGLITTEDIVEVLFGDIEDEFDEDEQWLRKIDATTWHVYARMEVQELNEALALTLPVSSDFETLAGLLIHHLKRIPAKGDQLELDGLRFSVLSASGRKVDWLKLEYLGLPAG